MPPESSSPGQLQPGSGPGSRWGGPGDLLTPVPPPPQAHRLLLAGLDSAGLAPIRHRLPTRAKWEGAACKVSAARSGLGPRTGCLSCPGVVITSLLPLLQGGTAAPRSFLFAFPVAPTGHVNARASSASGPDPASAFLGAKGRRLPWRPPCFAPGAGGCGILRALALQAWRLTSRPGGGGGGDTAQRRARPACFPTPSRPRGSCGRRQPIGWTQPGPLQRA